MASSRRLCAADRVEDEVRPFDLQGMPGARYDLGGGAGRRAQSPRSRVSIVQRAAFAEQSVHRGSDFPEFAVRQGRAGDGRGVGTVT